jgi:hypothetical protein
MQQEITLSTIALLEAQGGTSCRCRGCKDEPRRPASPVHRGDPGLSPVTAARQHSNALGARRTRGICLKERPSCWTPAPPSNRPSTTPWPANPTPPADTHAHLRAAITRLTQRAQTLLPRAGHAASDATLTRLAATCRRQRPGTDDPGGVGGGRPGPGRVRPARRRHVRADRRRRTRAGRTTACARFGQDGGGAGASASGGRAGPSEHAAGGRAGPSGLGADAGGSRPPGAGRGGSAPARPTAGRSRREFQERAAWAATAAAQARQQAQGAEQDATAAAERLAVAQEAASAAEQAHVAQAALEGLEKPDPPSRCR